MSRRHETDLPVPEVAPPPSSKHHRSARALKEVMPELAGVSSSEFATLNVNVTMVASTVLGCAPRIKELTGEIKEQLPKFPSHIIDQLETYALATQFAHLLYIASSQPQGDLAAKVDKLIRYREILVTEAGLLCKRGHLDPAILPPMSGSTAYLKVATDASAISLVLKSRWHSFEGKTGLQREEIESALDLSDEVLVAVGVRAHAEDAKSSPTETRARAFTLLVQRWDDVRRAVSYLRWKEGDADELAPSLYTVGRSSPAKKQDEADDTASTADDAAGAAQGTVAAAPAGVPVAAGGTPTGTAAPAAVAPGMPGHDPFGH